MLAEQDGKEGELVELLKLSPQDIWNRDLDNFLGEWEVRFGNLSVIPGHDTNLTVSDSYVSKRISQATKLLDSRGKLLSRLRKEPREKIQMTNLMISNLSRPRQSLSPSPRSHL